VSALDLTLSGLVWLYAGAKKLKYEQCRTPLVESYNSYGQPWLVIDHRSYFSVAEKIAFCKTKLALVIETLRRPQRRPAPA